MFSTPSIQIIYSENADSTLQKKAVSQPISRKPFCDRPVNGKTPMTKEFKNNMDLGSHIKIKVSPKLERRDVSPKYVLDDEDFVFSGKNITDTYSDIWPLKLGNDYILKGIKNHAYSELTPPPSPPIEEKKFTIFDLNDFHTLSMEKPVQQEYSFEEPGLCEFEDFEDSF